MHDEHVRHILEAYARLMMPVDTPVDDMTIPQLIDLVLQSISTHNAARFQERTLAACLLWKIAHD